MLLRAIHLENVRSFKNKTHLNLDGPISIIIGPNGGGKTNLLDTIVITIKRYLFNSTYISPAATAENPDRYEFRYNDTLNSLILDRHSGCENEPQKIEIEVEVTNDDIENMHQMKKDADKIIELGKKNYANLASYMTFGDWDFNEIKSGNVYLFRLIDGSWNFEHIQGAQSYFEYLQKFDIDKRMREIFGISPLKMPLIYLPVTRSHQAFHSYVDLPSFNEFEVKRSVDAISSRNSGLNIIPLAIGRLAERYRLLQENDNTNYKKVFYEDESLKELTNALKDLGYGWELITTNAKKNQYNIQLHKQGKSFLVSAASSGEKELLTYLFAIYALNVRDALIIVDEPELHLHPKWQKMLLDTFTKLSLSTGNQFILATHSPTFVSPESIQYVSRVFIEEQISQIVRLNTFNLPSSKHLLNIVNSQNNERLFFADEVVLVEGISDRIFFEGLTRYFRKSSPNKVVEFIDVGGKHLFSGYAKLLDACAIKYSIIADLDYISEVGTPNIKSFAKVKGASVKSDVINNITSMDGDTLVRFIDEAMGNGNWDNAKEVWEYIKSKRLVINHSLNPQQKTELNAFLEDMASKRTYILSLGTLESYLPEGHNKKDVEKLINLLDSDNFFEQLEDKGKEELKAIIDKIFP